jgi:hypothetical protein
VTSDFVVLTDAAHVAHFLVCVVVVVAVCRRVRRFLRGKTLNVL